MNLTNVKTIKNLCQEYGIRPSRKLGQNFLINRNVLNKMVELSELKKGDLVLEIGPGFGVLTQELVKYVKQVVAVEKDKRMAEFLKTRIQEYKNLSSTEGGDIKLINGDILKLFHCSIVSLLSELSGKQLNNEAMKQYKIISNLPYQITSPVLWKFLHEEEKKTELLVLMVQKEVAERICARPGAMSILSVLCQFYADCRIMAKVNRNNFWPQPEVDSAIIKLKIKNQKPVLSKVEGLKTNEEDFFKLVKIGFGYKRKMLKNNLARKLKMPAEKVSWTLKLIGLDEKVRAEELEVEQWVSLYQTGLTHFKSESR